VGMKTFGGSRRLYCGGLLTALLLCFVPAAAAQDNATTQPSTTAVTIEPGVTPAPRAFSGFSPKPWQVAIGYQYNRIWINGTFQPFSTNGVNLSVVRYFRRGLGVEGQVGSGFGTAALGDSMWSLFAGAGPRFAYRGLGHWEPWAHGLVGAEHYHFSQPFPFGSTSVAWMAGGGIDYRLDNGLSLRAEGDYVGTGFGGVLQRNAQIAGAVVWNF